MSDDKGSRSLTAVPTGALPSTIQLGGSSQIDLSWMSEEERRALLNVHARDAIALARRAHELGVEVADLRSTLDTLAGATQKVSQAGDAVTLTHVHNSSSGRTEVIMGNTETAAKGKLSRTQTGEFNWIPVYIIGGAIAALVIVSTLIRH